MNGTSFSVRFGYTTTILGTVFATPFYNAYVVPILLVEPAYANIRINRVCVQAYQYRDSITDPIVTANGHQMILSLFEIALPNTELISLNAYRNDLSVNTEIDDNIGFDSFNLYSWDELNSISTFNGKKVLSTVGMLPNVKLYYYESRIEKRYIVNNSDNIAFGSVIEIPFNVDISAHSNYMFSVESFIEFSIL